MSPLSEDLETCVQRTEVMLIAWTEFALKYSRENVNLDIQKYRERLITAFKQFDEISREVDKIVFCSSRSSSPSSTEISQANPHVQLFTPNVEVGDQRRNARHLSPAQFKTEARHFESRKSEVGRKSPNHISSAASEEVAVVDLTVDSPSRLEIEEAHSLNAGFANKSINSTSVKDTQNDLVANLSTPAVSTVSNREGNTTPLSEQLYLSDEDLEDTVRYSKTNTENPIESPASSHSLNQKSTSVSFQPKYIHSPGSQSNTQSFFDLSVRNKRVTLSVPNKAPKNYKNRRDSFMNSDGEKRPKNFQRKGRRTRSCGICKNIFLNQELLDDHVKTMHPGTQMFRTFCRGCGQSFRRFEADSHYSQCLVYKYENHDDRINGMRLVLEKPESILDSDYDLDHLKRQRKLLAECNDIDIPAVPPIWRVSRRINTYFEATNSSRNREQRN